MGAGAELCAPVLNVLYNSATFSILSAHDYYIVLATSGFLLPQLAPTAMVTLDYSEVLAVHDRLQNSSLAFEKLDNQDCLEECSQRFVTNRSHSFCGITKGLEFDGSFCGYVGIDI